MHPAIQYIRDMRPYFKNSRYEAISCFFGSPLALYHNHLCSFIIRTYTSLYSEITLENTGILSGSFKLHPELLYF